MELLYTVHLYGVLLELYSLTLTLEYTKLTKIRSQKFCM